jgi:hypothetical protein
MLDGVRAGLDRADKMEVGTTAFDLQAYLRHAAGITRAGVHGDISSRLTESISAFAAADLGLMRMRGNTTIEARAMAGIRGTF